MAFLTCFLVGVAVGALLTYHLSNVAALRRRVQDMDRDKHQP